MRKVSFKSIFTLIVSGIMCQASYGQDGEMIEYLPLGNMDNWINRIVSESTIIGGKTKILYEIAKGRDIQKENTAYSNMNGSPWATSNVYAHVAIVHKGVNTVKAERRGAGYCASMTTSLEHVKVLGVINLNVIATGTIFLGEMIEPITSTDNGNLYLDRGIPFNRRPKTLVFDYALKNVAQRIYAPGLAKPKNVTGCNGAEVVMILQKRWEDANGNIYAKRVGMAWQRLFDEDGVWHDKYKMKVYYGDCTNYDFHRDYMALEQSGKDGIHTMYALNSKGVMKPIIEIGWTSENDTPTHLVLSFSSGWGGAFTGSPGTQFSVDNIGFIY